MIALIQRVSHAEVSIAGTRVARIERGILALVGVQRGDTAAQGSRLLERVLGYRIFADHEGRMDRSLRDVAGGLLLVPQFTLAADTARGTRASFTPAAAPDLGQALFEALCSEAARVHQPVAIGRFAADMQVALVNDGPVTFWLEARASGTN